MLLILKRRARWARTRLRGGVPRRVNAPLLRSVLLVAGAVFAASANATIITVNTAQDRVNALDGQCSLREAITASNENQRSGKLQGECAAGEPAPRRDKIFFELEFNGQPTIILSLNTRLPVLTDGYLTINGLRNTPAALGSPPAIALSGDRGAHTVNVNAAIHIYSSHNEIRGLAIHGFRDYGIGIFGYEGSLSRHNWIVGNTFGLSANGVLSWPIGAREPTPGVINVLADLFVGSFTRDTIVGTNGDGRRDELEWNLFSGEVFLHGDYSIVSGNRFGSNRQGSDHHQSARIYSDSGCSLNVVGLRHRIGTNGDGLSDVEERNLFVAQGGRGAICVSGAAGLDQLRIAGNHFGVNLAGMRAVPIGTGIRCNLCEEMVIGSDNPAQVEVEANVFGKTTESAITTVGSSGWIAGNRFGVKRDGTSLFQLQQVGFDSSRGIDAIGDSAEQLTIGGLVPELGNLFANQYRAIEVSAPEVLIQNNVLGVKTPFQTFGFHQGIVLNSPATVICNKIQFGDTGILLSTQLGYGNPGHIHQNWFRGNRQGVYASGGLSDIRFNYWNHYFGPSLEIPWNGKLPFGDPLIINDPGADASDYYVPAFTAPPSCVAGGT